MLSDFFVVDVDIDKDELEIFTEFWIRRLEHTRDVLVNHQLLRRWFLVNGQRHFGSYDSFLRAAEWAEESVSTLDYLKTAKMCVPACQTEFWVRECLCAQRLGQLRNRPDVEWIILQLSLIYVQPPRLETFDRLLLYPTQSEMDEILLVDGKPVDLSWLTME